MLHFYTGTDTEKLRAKLNAATGKIKGEVLRITDAHSVHDLQAALEGGGLFAAGQRGVVLENTLSNLEMRDIVLGRLAALRGSDDVFFVMEPALDAVARKQIERYSEKTERFDISKQKKAETIFALANALQKGKKKDLWVGYRREIANGKSPENIHGVLFWAAKQQLLRNAADSRARMLVARLAELPHEARRAGMDFEYALEHFTLTLA